MISFIGAFYDKKCVVFSITSFGTLKYDCVIKTIEMFKNNRNILFSASNK